MPDAFIFSTQWRLPQLLELPVLLIILGLLHETHVLEDLCQLAEVDRHVSFLVVAVVPRNPHEIVVKAIMQHYVRLVVDLVLLSLLLLAQIVVKGLLDLQSARSIFVQVVEFPLEILGFAIYLWDEGQSLVFILDVVLDSLELLIFAIDLRGNELVGGLLAVLSKFFRNLADLWPERRLVELLQLFLVNSVLKSLRSATFPHYLISHELVDVSDLGLVEVLRRHIRHL